MTETSIDRQFGSILVVVPHQDDEILLAAGILHAAASCGLKAKVAMATNGDYGCEDFKKGQKRLRESLEGLMVLGLKKEQLIPLGYADTGMEREVSFLMQLYEEKDEKKVFPSSCSQRTYGLPEWPEHHFQVYGEHAAYNRENFKRDLKDVILREKPDHIFTTSKYDLHGDHEALYLFVRDILNETKQEGYSPRLYTGLVHSMAGDACWPLRQGDAYTCPAGFSDQTEFAWEDRISFPLPKDMLGGNEMKRRALKKHEEALEPNAVEYLMSFLKEEEIFWLVSPDK